MTEFLSGILLFFLRNLHDCIFNPLRNIFTDVLGIVRSADELTSVVSKQTQKELKKRDITLVDSGQVQIRMTLWGNDVRLSIKTRSRYDL